MSRRLVTCIVLHCDHCGLPLGDCGAMHFERVPRMETVALDLGWSTDGEGAWHCAECPALTDTTPRPAPLIGGQQSMELGEDKLERMLQRVGLMPWRA